MPAQHTMGQMDLELRGGGASSNLCPAPTSRQSRNFPEVPSWKSEGSHLCPATPQKPWRGYSYSASPSLLLPPSQQPTPIWDLAE